MDATVDGYARVPRMIDKARAATAGTLGDYYRYPARSTGPASTGSGSTPTPSRRSRRPLSQITT